MQIHVARPPAQLGVFSVEEVSEGLRTGRFLPTDQAWRDGMAAWVPLNQWVEFAAVGVPASPSVSTQAALGEPMPSWERGSSVSHFFATFREVTTSPVQTFDNLSPAGGFSRPLVFNYLTAAPGFLFLFGIYAALFSFLGSDMLRDLATGPAANVFAGVTKGGLIGILAAGLCCLFLLAPLGLFIGAGFSHLLLLPWGPKGGYAGSFRASAYVNGVFFPLTCIPCVNYVALPWQLVVNVIALARIHRIEWWKVLVSVVVVPCVLCCSIYGFFFMALIKARTGL